MFGICYHFKFNGQDDWGDMYDHLKYMRIFTLKMKQKFHMSSNAPLRGES